MLLLFLPSCMHCCQLSKMESCESSPACHIQALYTCHVFSSEGSKCRFWENNNNNNNNIENNAWPLFVVNFETTIIIISRIMHGLLFVIKSRSIWARYFLFLWNFILFLCSHFHFVIKKLRYFIFNFFFI